ncbi:dephospho-CoA kinase [Bacteroides sp. KG68]|uniref:dephospho-CoA kinase n=1 Tax=unclassified Bacteroides TaxID=2646097 RepID=UPI003D986D4B
MAIKIGITGGIGSGKSMVSHLLQIMGIPVYISDVEAKRLMCSDSSIRKELQALLGKEIYAGNALNRQLLASYLFANPEHVQIINGIIHPCVKRDFRRWVHCHIDSLLIGIESAILVEAGFADEVDVIVMVYAPEEVRISRAISRDASSRELIKKRIQSQMSDEEKRKYADFVIVNDGETPLIPQVLEFVASLNSKAHSLSLQQPLY